MTAPLATRGAATAAPDALSLLVAPLAVAERRHIERALSLFGGNRRQTARALRISEKTLYRKLKEYAAHGAGWGGAQ